MSDTKRYNPETHQKDATERRYLRRKWSSKAEKEAFYRAAFVAPERIEQKEAPKSYYAPIENSYMANDGMIGDMEPDDGYGNS